MKKILFIIFTIIMVLGAANMALGGSEPVDRYYNQITVEKGDTLWEIASQHQRGDLSIKEYIKEIKSMNSMESDKIIVGQRLIVPYYK